MTSAYIRVFVKKLSEVVSKLKRFPILKDIESNGDSERNLTFRETQLITADTVKSGM